MAVLSELRARLGETVDGVDASTVAPETAVAAVGELAAIERLVAGLKLALVARVVGTEAWRGLTQKI